MQATHTHTCVLDGCGKPSHQRVCSMHRERMRKYGSYELPARPSTEERFWSKVVQQDDGDCWLWTAHATAQGYGRFRSEGETENAHRVAYRLLIGEIPPGLALDHLCRNPSCVNPYHLDPVTVAVNSVRAGAANRRDTCCNGHVFDEANTYTDARGRRSCRACGRDRARIYAAQRKAREVSSP